MLPNTPYPNSSETLPPSLLAALLMGICPWDPRRIQLTFVLVPPSTLGEP